MIGRRRLFGGLAAAVAAQSLGACKPHDRLTVVLDWLFNVNHAALFAAQQTGAFARAGLDVALISPADPDSPSRLVAAGQADLAVSYGTQINMLVDKGLPLLRVASLIDRPMNSVMALAGSGIGAIKDLKGRRVGIAVGGVEEAILNAMLRSGGLAPSEVTTTRVNYQMVTAMLSHRIDAATGAFRNAEVLQVQDAGERPVVFAPEDHGVAPYDELILVTRRDRLGDPRLPRFLSALREGTGALLKDPDGLWRAFRSAHPDQNTKTIERSWPITLSWLARDPAALDRGRYLGFQQFCLAQGIVSKALPLERFAVQIRA